MKIIVNGTTHETDAGITHMSYESIVGLAGEKLQTTPSVTYRAQRVGEDDARREGALSPGRLVRIEDGMVFNAIRTGNA